MRLLEEKNPLYKIMTFCKSCVQNNLVLLPKSLPCSKHGRLKSGTQNISPTLQPNIL